MISHDGIRASKRLAALQQHGLVHLRCDSVQASTVMGSREWPGAHLTSCTGQSTRVRAATVDVCQSHTVMSE